MLMCVFVAPQFEALSIQASGAQCKSDLFKIKNKRKIILNRMFSFDSQKLFG